MATKQEWWDSTKGIREYFNGDYDTFLVWSKRNGHTINNSLEFRYGEWEYVKRNSKEAIETVRQARKNKVRASFKRPNRIMSMKARLGRGKK